MADDTYHYNRGFYNKDGYIYCEGFRLKDLRDKLRGQLTQPSPFFVVSRREMEANIRDYKEALVKFGLNDARLGYAIKANYNPCLLRLMHKAGCTGIAVSGNELRLAIKVGMDPKKLVLNGNGKVDWELQFAVTNGCLINVDSIFDYGHVVKAAEKVGKKGRILLRLNPDIDSKVHPFLSTGLAVSKFGIDDPDLDTVLFAVSGEKNVELVGLHCHLGSTITNVRVFKGCMETMLKTVKKLKEKGVTGLQFLNLGGGLGIDYTKHLLPVPTPEDLIEAVGAEIKASGLTLILEPGRSIIGGTTMLVCQVLGCKKNRSVRYIVTDGSMNEVIRPCLYSAYHHIELTEPPSNTEKRLHTVVGPICECSDFLGKDRHLAEPDEGSGIAIFDTGAYCGSMAANYNMRMRPAEILVDGDQYTIMRRPETFDDIIAKFQFSS